MSVLPKVLGSMPPTEQARELISQSDELRKMSINSSHTGIRQRLWGLEARLDPTVTFEEFTFWAKIEREMEDEEYRLHKATASSRGILESIKHYFVNGPYDDAQSRATDQATLRPVTHDSEWSAEKTTLASLDERSLAVVKPIGPTATYGTHELDAEWRTAARALRTAGWGTVFYLITTDVLGWGQTPYVFSNLGYGLGVGIFLLMGIAAGASGFMIWSVYIKLDSSRYPMLSFGDPFFRLLGPKARHFINVSQALQMLVSVAIVLLGHTHNIAQLAGRVDLCFVVCGIISLVVCLFSGYFRSLNHLGWLCNASVWINITTFIIVCAAAAKYGPDPVAQVSTGVLPKSWIDNPAPVKTFAGTPPPLYQPTDKNLFAARFNGINSIVYAYSGAIFFVAFLSEMRRPMDFWKAMTLAQSFITIVYIFFGCFTYSFFGQYAFAAVNQVVQPFNLQVACNVLSLVIGWLAVFLYFNVGMKTVYLEVGQHVLGLPSITTTKGKYIWWSLGPVYWIIAFVIAMSIPQFNAFVNFVGGLFGINFTYTISGVMFLAYKTQEGARLDGEGFNPATGETRRFDGGLKRWQRGFLRNWLWTIPALIYTLCGLAASGMGTYAAIEGLISAFGPGGSVLTSWTCKNPFYKG